MQLPQYPSSAPAPDVARNTGERVWRMVAWSVLAGVASKLIGAGVGLLTIAVVLDVLVLGGYWAFIGLAAAMRDPTA